MKTANCNKEHDDQQLLETDVVTLTSDDDEIECAVLTVLEMDSKEYIALLPLNEDGTSDDGDVWFYEFSRDTTGGDNHDIINIEDDDEYERVSDKFDEWLDANGYEDPEADE